MGRFYWQRPNISDFTVTDVSEQFADKALKKLRRAADASASHAAQPQQEGSKDA